MEKVNISLRIEEAESLGMMVHFRLEELYEELEHFTTKKNEERIVETIEDIQYYQNIHKKIHKKIIPVIERNF